MSVKFPFLKLRQHFITQILLLKSTADVSYADKHTEDTDLIITV